MKRRKMIFFSVPFLAISILLMAVFSACGGGGGTVPSVAPTQEARPTPTNTPESAVLPREVYTPPHTRPGPAVEKIEFVSAYVDQAVNEVKANKVDFYAFGLKVEAAKKVRNGKSIKIYQSPASSVSILLNPAPDPRGLNPFSIKEVRQAMSYLINRDFITQDIYGGFAEPMLSHVSPSDFDYSVVAADVLKSGVRYDFDYAKSAIDGAVRSYGAELVNGKWHYKGQPIRLKFIIRSEDERREIGDSLARALEQAGFTLNVSYKEFAAAISTVYTTDPQAFEWHLYTEGWGRGSADRYDFANINSMAAPWLGNMPGWQIMNYWQYKNDELDRLGKKLFTGNFTSKDERDALYKEMTALAIGEAVRIWVASVYNTFPAQKGLSGITEDLVAGPKSLLALREAYIEGKDTLRVGNLWVWTERSVWNPVGGFGDVYSIDIWKNMADPPLINHPFSGVPMPFRVRYEVETAGPSGFLAVPQDAVMWDAKKDVWARVPAGTAARSKVVFDYTKYFQSRWHHGAKISMADVLYELHQTFENTYDANRSEIEFVLASTRKPILDVFRGFRVLDENRLEVYLDFWHFEENYIASYANLVSLSMPWEILAAMDALVYPKEGRPLAAYSQSAAARFNVPWLSLVMKSDAALVMREIRKLQKSGFQPQGVFMGYETNAGERFNAASKWFDKYSHLVISQGPFTLTRYDPTAQYAELTAFRDAGYPFKPGDWYMGKPEIIKIQAPSDLTVIRNEKKPVEVPLELTAPGAVSIRFFLLDPSSGEIMQEGAEDPSLSSKAIVLQPTNWLKQVKGNVLHLYLLAYSDSISLVTQKKVDIIVR